MMNKLFAGLLALSIASPALAWGDREQGILTGVAGYWLFDKFRNMPQQQQQQQYPQQQYPQQYPRGQQGGGIYAPQINSVPPMQPQGNYVYTCYVQVQDPYTGMVQLQQQVCLGR